MTLPRPSPPAVHPSQTQNGAVAALLLLGVPHCAAAEATVIMTVRGPIPAAARRGAWISLDGWNPMLAVRHLETLRQLKAADQLHRVLLSHDGNLYPARGARPRPIDWLLGEGRAALAAAGIAETEWVRMTATNPATAFAVGVRRSPAAASP